MSRSPRAVRLATAAAAFVGAALVAPAAASAHGLVGRQDLPIPRWLFAWAAAIVLVISFVALATLWPKPRLEEPRAPRRRFAVPPLPFELLGGILGIGAFAAVVYAGFAGAQTETANLANTSIFVIFWIGIPVLSVVFGDVFRLFNPWRAVGRAFGWLMRRVGGDATPEPLAYPSWLGRWPSVIGILAFAWVELVYSGRSEPDQLAGMAVAYAAFQLIGMSLYGVEVWCSRADAFGVYFNLFSRMSPITWRAGTAYTRIPLSGVPSLELVPGTVALLATMIGTTSFDGFSQGPTWTSIAPHLQDFFKHFGFTQEHALEAGYTVGLFGVVLIIGALYRLGIKGMGGIGGSLEESELSRRFVHSLIPIAFAYVVAHYCSFLLYQGQAMGYLISDPLGDGSNIFGTANATIDYGVISATQVWYVQVVALVVGHASGLVLAHDRALVLYRKARDATRSQYWMLAVMVGFTSLGLWLLSAQSQ